MKYEGHTSTVFPRASMNRTSGCTLRFEIIETLRDCPVLTHMTSMSFGFVTLGTAMPAEDEQPRHKIRIRENHRLALAHQMSENSSKWDSSNNCSHHSKPKKQQQDTA